MLRAIAILASAGFLASCATPAQVHMKQADECLRAAHQQAQNGAWTEAEALIDSLTIHLREGVQHKPMRPVPQGEVDLRPLLDSFEKGPLVALKNAVDRKNSQAFTAAARLAGAQCISCHLAAGKPDVKLEQPWL